jgi:hypothetical protein
MTRVTRVVSAAASLIAVGLVPVTGEAQHRVHGRHGVGGQVLAGHNHGGRVHHRSFGNRVVVFAPFVPVVPFAFGSWGAPSLVYSDPSANYAPPMSDPTPIAYGPPPAYTGRPASAYAPPAAPAYAPPRQDDVEPLQREVVFPSGRYVLRGDGMSTPYTWVWIPNPPSAPPGGAPSSSRERERPVYSWTDADGVTTWTDRPWTIPAQYRASARREL